MKFFHDIDEPSRPFTAREHDLIARLMKAEAAETIRRRNIDRRWRDMPEEFAGAKPPTINPHAGKNTERHNRALILDERVLTEVTAGRFFSGDIVANTGIPQSTVQASLLRLRKAGKVVFDVVNYSPTQRVYHYRPAEGATAALEPLPLPSPSPEEDAAVAPNLAGSVQTFLSRGIPAASTEDNRVMRITMPRAPWQQEAAE